MIQLLFVDDEPSVLEGLENRLRPWRREWQLRSLPVADQSLSKPCDGEHLRAVIHRCSALQAALFRPRVKAAIAGVGTLPALPRHCLELSAERDRAQPSVNRVAEIIERDIAMSARLLQVCNEASP